MIKSAARTTYRFLQRNLPPQYANYIDTVLGKKTKVYDYSRVNEFHLSSVSGAEAVSGPALQKKIMEAYYGKISADVIVPTNDTPYAQSYLPFIKGHTGVFVYNFFEKNYALRDPILYRIVIISNGQVAYVKNKIVSPSSMLYMPNILEDANGSADRIPEQGLLIVQAIHPRIKTPTNQLRYFGIFSNPKTGPAAGVHALRLAADGIVSVGPLGFRAFGSTGQICAFGADHPNLPMRELAQCSGGKIHKQDISEKLKGVAFFVQKTQSGDVSTVWHDGPTPHFVTEAASPSKLGKCVTAFIVPDFDTHAPIVVVDYSQVGFKPKKITFTARDKAGKHLAERAVDFESLPANVDLRELFAKDGLTGLVSIIADFHRDLGELQEEPACMLLVYYRSRDGLGDQNHSHHTFGYSNAPKPAAKSFRCMKFAPLILEDGIDCVYSVVNIGGRGTNRDESVFVRVLSDTGAEVKFSIPVPADGVSVFTTKDILEKINSNVRKVALVQLEHPTTNFNGNWHLVNSRAGTVGTDHFTGG